MNWVGSDNIDASHLSDYCVVFSILVRSRGCLAEDCVPYMYKQKKPEFS